MKRSEVLKYINSFLKGYEDSGFEEEREDDADIILSHLEKLGMLPPSIPTGATGWEVGKGEPSYVNEWESEDE